MDDMRIFNDISRNPTTVSVVSPIPFETSSEQYYFSPISNQIQGASPDMYWQYTNDHRRSPYPNGFNTVGQYQYWRHSPYPTGDQMLMREWSTSSPDHCNYQIPPWSMEAVSMVQGMSMHQMNHGISQWSTGGARSRLSPFVFYSDEGQKLETLDFSGCGDTSVSDIVSPPEFPRDDHMSLEHDNRICSSFTASPWQQANSAPLITELLGGEPRYSACRWQSDGIPNLCDSVTKDMENKSVNNMQIETPELNECKEKINEISDKSKVSETELEDDSEINQDNEMSTSEETPQKKELHTKSSRKPEAYNRQKKLQREREGLIRNAIQALNLILPEDNHGKKLSKNLVLLKAIDHIKKLKEKLGDTPIVGIDIPKDKSDGSSDESTHRKPKRRKKSTTPNVSKTKEKKDCQLSPVKISCNFTKMRSSPPIKLTPSPPQKQTHSSLVPKPIPSPQRAPVTTTSPGAANNSKSTEKKFMVLNFLQDPAILTPSDTSGSDRAESPTTDDDVLHHEAETTSHVKRPMNAFLLFSKSNRENFKKMYPGKDNRRISTMLGEHWNTMKAEDKQPFQEMARELMRKTKEAHPDFKYSPTDQSSKVKNFKCFSKEDSPRNGIRVGNHRLRSRYGKEQNSDSSISSDGNLSSKETDASDFKSRVKHKTHRRDMSSNDKMDAGHTKEQATTQSPVKKTQKLYHAQYSRCDNWVQCDKCKKWRMLHDEVNPDDLPDKWFCWMSVDPRVNDCQVPEAVRWSEMRKQGILKDGE